MKRILSLITALVIILGASSAMAQEQKTFFYSGYMLTYATIDKTIVKEGTIWTYNAVFGQSNVTAGNSVTNMSNSFLGQRIRPYFSYKTEKVEATIKFESDWMMGAANGCNATVGCFTAKNKHPNVALGSDTPMFLELKEAYIKINVPDVKGLSLMGGINALLFAGYGVGYFAEEAPQVRAYYAFGESTALGQSNINAFFVPLIAGIPYQYSTVAGADKSASVKQNLYGLEGNVMIQNDMGVMKITPTIWWIHTGKQVGIEATDGLTSASSLYHGKNGQVPGLGFLGIFQGKITVLANIAVPMGRSDQLDTASKQKEYFAVNALLDASYALKMGQKVGIYGVFQTGDKSPWDNKVKSVTDSQPGAGFNALTGRFWFFETGGMGNFVAGNNLIYNPADLERFNTLGLYLAGLYADFTFKNKFQVYLAVGSAWSAVKPNLKTKDTRKFGYEGDLVVAYKVEGARIFGEFAYLITKDAYLNKGGPTAYSTHALFGGVGVINKVRNAMHFGVGMDINF